MTHSRFLGILEKLWGYWGIQNIGAIQLPELPFAIPRGLSDVYSAFYGNWECGGRRIFGFQDCLLGIDQLERTDSSWHGHPCTPGRIFFAAENQAVWTATTLAEALDDCPVEFYYDSEPVRTLDSLNQFLASLMLRETVMGSAFGGSSSARISDPVWSERGFSHLMTDTDQVVGWHYTDFYANSDGTILLATYADETVAALASKSPLPPWPDVTT